MSEGRFFHSITKRIRAIPAGIFLVPLFFASVLHTLVPGVLEIGSYTTALFSGAGAATLIALQLFCIGAQIRYKSIVTVLRHGSVLLLARVAAGLLIALVYRLFAKDDIIAGVSIFAAVAAFSNTNGSVFVATTSLFNKGEAAAAAPVLALSNGPFLTVLILGVSGSAQISWWSAFALVLPMLLGLLVGNISVKASVFLAPGVKLLLPFVGFALGAGIDLRQLWQGGVSGLLLAVCALAVGGALAFAFDRWLNREDGVAGIAASATGANAIAIPAAVAMTNPAWQSVAGIAAAQIAASAIFGAILVPLLAKAWSTHLLKKQQHSISI